MFVWAGVGRALPLSGLCLLGSVWDFPSCFGRWCCGSKEGDSLFVAETTVQPGSWQLMVAVLCPALSALLLRRIP